MRYVTQALVEGERPVHIGHFHWSYDVKALAWLIGFSWFFGIGLFMFLKFLAQRFSTEIVITNHRLFYKTGFLSRRAYEMNLNRIEGCEVDQTVLGRLLGYGYLVVRGTGVGEIHLPMIANPIIFRKALDEARTTED